MDIITAEEIQAVETAALALSAKARLLDLACGGLCREEMEGEGQLCDADIEPVHDLAKEVTALAGAVEEQATSLRSKISEPRVRPAA